MKRQGKRTAFYLFLHPINHDGSIILSEMKRESISTSVITQGDQYTKVVPENAHAVALFSESCFNYVAKLC